MKRAAKIYTALIFVFLFAPIVVLLLVCMAVMRKLVGRNVEGGL